MGKYPVILAVDNWVCAEFLFVGPNSVPVTGLCLPEASQQFPAQVDPVLLLSFRKVLARLLTVWVKSKMVPDNHPEAFPADFQSGGDLALGQPWVSPNPLPHRFHNLLGSGGAWAT